MNAAGIASPRCVKSMARALGRTRLQFPNLIRRFSPLYQILPVFNLTLLPSACTADALICGQTRRDT